MAECRCIGFGLAAFFLLSDVLLTHSRHNEHVAQVATSGSAQVCVREAVDGAVVVIITRASVPTIDAGVGAGLNGSVRHHRSGISVSVTACSDKHIYILCVIIASLLSATATGSQSHGNEQSHKHRGDLIQILHVVHI